MGFRLGAGRSLPHTPAGGEKLPAATFPAIRCTRRCFFRFFRSARVFPDARYNGGVSILAKQRTREHIIADLSVNYAERQFLLAGYANNRVMFDYGYDLFIHTFDAAGHLETGLIQVQVKASDAPEYSKDRDYVTVRVDERDDATWRAELYPVVLILYDAAEDAAYFVHYQSLPFTTRRSIRIPTDSRFNTDAARNLRDVKDAAIKGYF